jgi:hypothetical protein
MSRDVQVRVLLPAPNQKQKPAFNILEAGSVLALKTKAEAGFRFGFSCTYGFMV